MKEKEKTTIEYNMGDITAEREVIARNVIDCMAQAAHEAVNKVAQLAEDSPPWMCKMKLLGPAAMKDPEISALLAKAQADGEVSFFKELVSHLSTVSPGDDEFRNEVAKDNIFFLENWLKRPSAGLDKSLCYYSDVAIAKVFSWYFGITERSSDTVRKKWERLGLKRSKYTLFRDVELTSKGLLPIPFKKIGQ